MEENQHHSGTHKHISLGISENYDHKHLIAVDLFTFEI